MPCAQGAFAIVSSPIPAIRHARADLASSPGAADWTIALAWSARAIPGEGHTPLKRRIAQAPDAVEELEQEGDG